MIKVLAITFFIALVNVGLAQETAPTTSGPGVTDSALLERLQSGGLVLVFRHGKTGPDSDRPDAISGRQSYAGSITERQAAYRDCNRQRNLSDGTSIIFVLEHGVGAHLWKGIPEDGGPMPLVGDGFG